MKRMVKVTDSKIINNFSESMNGNSTIRALDSQDYIKQLNFTRNNENALAKTVERATDQWYQVQTHNSSLILQLIVILLIVNNRDKSNAVVISIALKEILELGSSIKSVIHRFKNLDGNMVSIKRCLNLLEIP